MELKPRKIVQLTTSGGSEDGKMFTPTVFIVCDDGTAWFAHWSSDGFAKWTQIEPPCPTPI